MDVQVLDTHEIIYALGASKLELFLIQPLNSMRSFASIFQRRGERNSEVLRAATNPPIELFV
jgi:hypothetical protein